MSVEAAIRELRDLTVSARSVGSETVSRLCDQALKFVKVQWVPIKSASPTAGQYVLMAGESEEGHKWRDAGLYRGQTDGIHEFVDKYGADAHPTHWCLLPTHPSIDNDSDSQHPIEELIDFIIDLHQHGAIHIKRGFSLRDSSKAIASNHLLEEAVELQAETMHGTEESITEEASDVLAIWLHLLVHCNISFESVVERCHTKLRQTFTFDESETTTNNPGFTRRNRVNSGKLGETFHKIWTDMAHQDGRYNKEDWNQLVSLLRTQYGVEV